MSNHILKGGWLNVESKNIAVSAIILAVSSVISRLLGVLRDWLLAERFGACSDLDVYFAAFRIPDFIYNLLVFGGIVVAFLPLFSDYYNKNKDEAWRFANNTLNVFLALLVIICSAAFIFTPQLVAMIAPGFSPEQLEKTAGLSRLMFLSPIIFGVASIFSGILQYFRRFLAYSLAASIYNIGIIAGIIFLTPSLGIYGVAIGVIVGALFYLIIQIIPAIKCGYFWHPIFNFREPSLGRVVALMLPRTVGIAANQINLIAPNIIGSMLAAGSITIFNLANNVFSLPVVIVGISYATAAFASFSKLFCEGRLDDLSRKFSQTFCQVGFLAIPLGFLIFALRDPIVAILYRHGQFSHEAAMLTSAALGFFCLGIYFCSTMPLIFRLFFSFKDTILPTVTTVISVVANISMNYLFVDALRAGAFSNLVRDFIGLNAAGDISVIGLALAYSLANALQFALLVILLYWRNARLIRTEEIISSFLKTLAAGIFMLIAVYLVIAATPQSGSWADVLTIIGATFVGGVAYLIATALLKSPELIYFRDSIKKILRNYGTNKSSN